MATFVSLVLLLAVLAIHSLVSAVAVRFFRLRLEAEWSWVVYTALIVPVVLLASTLLFTGPLGIGVDLGSPAVVFAVMIAVPIALGATVDLLYVPSPEEYELPDTQ
ncbi:MAG: hypothetical protein A07HR60_01237 [uncultured archaeon A07HR60]|nr:MAG: hypothetical protein J07HR59_01043 [Halorubrum sp. J07HR59]ESS11899.1 MAG: hypothetical protein A07HR60_01237 [uncultured archaeon A07HR60]